MEKLDIWNAFDGKTIREVVDYLTSKYEECDTIDIRVDTDDNLEFVVSCDFED
jgi:hypothetical protein